MNIQTAKFQFHKENAMYAQAAIKSNTLLRNGAYGIVMRGVQKCTRGCSSLRGRKRLPLCCIKLDTATDPACGSGGMFVQAARYMHRHNESEADRMKFRCYGIEKEPDTVKLAKMNLLLNNVRGEITEANTFYSDPYNSVGAFDYVMANPPFNVDEVVYSRVIEDARYNTYGVPRNKTKKGGKKDSDKKETVPNANYLWIGLFAAALNDTGKAALVMANSASDAGKSEYEIRKKLINEGVISQMVTLPSNMFTSVTLPATLWFFDKQKPHTEKKDEILFIDARNIFTQVDRAHRKFSDEQIKNLGIITRLYEGKTEELQDLLEEYKANVMRLTSELSDVLSKLCTYSFYFDANGKEAFPAPILRSCAPKCIDLEYGFLKDLNAENVSKLKEQIKAQDDEIMFAQMGLHFEQYYSKNQDKKIREYDALVEQGRSIAAEIIYYLDNLIWLLERFPDGKYRDVIGLCKAAKVGVSYDVDKHGKTVEVIEEDSIADQDYSLNAGRYVGVVIEDDGMTEEEFKATMLGLNSELNTLNEEAREFESQIAENMKMLFGE